jgi:hypothetical protein
MNFYPVRNPAELALPYAEEVVLSGYLDDFDTVHATERKRLEELEIQAAAAHMLGRQYFVSSGRSVILPAELEHDEIAQFESTDGIDFSGRLISFSTVRVGRIIGSNAVRALCLAFDNVTLMPFFEKIDDTKLLHAPAFAVRGIDELPAA